MNLDEAVTYALDYYDLEPSEEARDAGRMVATLTD